MDATPRVASSALVSLLIAGSATASPVGLGWTVTSVSVGSDTYLVGRVYVLADTELDVLSNVFNSSFSVIGGEFNHNDTSTLGLDSHLGSWSPNAFSSDVGDPAIDSFVLIGGDPGTVAAPTNTTETDPSFIATASTVTGGWYNSNPPNLQGRYLFKPEFNALAACAGQFVVKDRGSPLSLSVVLTQTSLNGFSGPSYPQTTFTGVFSYAIPAPGAATLLLAAAGIGGRRRKRSSPRK